ncbi:MAG: phage tail domain-containing protein, partial [Bradymonadales bacterium]
MFSATYFTYGGVYSKHMGLLIASFDAENIETTPVFSPVFQTPKSARARAFSHGGVKYEAPPQYQFTILSEQHISADARREILSWLVGRGEFQSLYLHQAQFENIEYRCVFTDTSIVYAGGQCRGFTVTAMFDSQFCYGEPYKKTFTGDGTQYEEITVVNHSDTIDGYVYPVVTISPSGFFADGTDDEGNDIYKEISIKNKSDPAGGNRAFEISGLLPDLIQPDEELYVDNELRIITKRRVGETATNPIGNAL